MAAHVLGWLNEFVRLAAEGGLQLRLRRVDGSTVELGTSRVDRIEWEAPDGEKHFVREVEVVTLAEGAALAGLSKEALYHRVRRAEKRGASTPFRRWGDAANSTYYASKAEFTAWVATWRRKPL
jgi:hypothetical protein